MGREHSADFRVFDLEEEQRYVLRTLARAARRGRRSSGGELDTELDQERVYVALRKRQDQKAYTEGARVPAQALHDAMRAGKVRASASRR